MIQESWEAFAQALILSAVPYLVPVVLSVIATAGAYVWSKIKALQPNLAEALEKAAKHGVYVSEQVGLKDKLELAGKEKLALAIEKAEAYLAMRGIKKFDINALVDAIEAEVLKASFPHKS